MLGFNSLGFGTRISTALAQALIDYRDWTAYTAVNGKRYITDKGISPKYPLALKSGSGVSFNGVDQSLSGFVVPPTATDMLYIKDGVNYHTTTLIDFGSIVPAGIYKDVYYFNRALTQAEITKNYEQPEQFFIDAKNDNTCVLNMPMNEAKDGAKSNVVINYQDMSEYPITNYTDASRVNGIPYGLQNSKVDRDVNGVIQDVSPYYEMDGKQVPAMSLDMTDTQLGSKFVIDFVIEKKLLALTSYLLFSRYSNTGMQFISSLSYEEGRINLRLYDGSTHASVLYDFIDENPHHIIFEVTETTMTMIVDGVAGTPVAHSFVPSGLNFKDSIQASPIGTLKHFRIYDESNFDSYDRQKSIDYVINKGLLL